MATLPGYDEWKTREPERDPSSEYQPTECACGAQLVWTGRSWVEMTPCRCPEEEP